MTQSEIIKLFAAISAAYPRDETFSAVSERTARIWASLLSDISSEAALSALTSHMASSPFPPTVADIRKWALPTDGDDGAAAWGRVMEAMRRYGSYDPQGAKALMGGKAWELVRTLFPSWRHLCASENMETNRAHFIRAWDSRMEQERRLALLPPQERMRIEKSCTVGYLGR